MKSLRTYSLIGLCASLLLAAALPAHAQDGEKERLRLSATYIKMMDGPLYLDLAASARIDRTTVEVPGAELEVYYEVDGEEFPLGTVTTDGSGKARFTMEGLEQIRPDSTGLYTLSASFAGNDAYRRASRSLSFRNADIRAELVQQDSLAFVQATLFDAAADSAVADALIKVQVVRMFRPLRISEEFLSTDDSGSIEVEVPPGIPGPGGNLELQVAVEDNDDYGTVIASLEAPVGTAIQQDTTYFERTLWAPRDRTPLFIIFFTGLLILGSWGLIVYLVRNLIKIAKN